MNIVHSMLSRMSVVSRAVKMSASEKPYCTSFVYDSEPINCLSRFQYFAAKITRIYRRLIIRGCQIFRDVCGLVLNQQI